jgi:pyruvate-formate lyase-activating enzyme
VKRTIELAAKACHVEVTTLIVPGENDSEEEMDALSSWLSSQSPEIPLHVSRFYPRYQMRDRGATPVKAVYGLADVARRHLKYVFTGTADAFDSEGVTSFALFFFPIFCYTDIQTKSSAFADCFGELWLCSLS